MGCGERFRLRACTKGKKKHRFRVCLRQSMSKCLFVCKLQGFYLRKSLSFSLEEGSYIRFIP